MDGLDFPILDEASLNVVHAAASAPVPAGAVGPILFVAIALLIAIALWDGLAPAKGPRR